MHHLMRHARALRVRRQGPRRLLAVLLALAAPGRLAGQAAVGGLTLAPCTVAGTGEPARCGTLTVFEDRERRAGRSIALNLMVLLATSGDPRPDPLFVLAGGPGQAATALAPVFGQMMPTVRETREIVLVDQRGTGRSNGLKCQPESLQGVLDVLAFDMSDEAFACRDRFDADLTRYTTPIAMDDLDDVRHALGYETINLWGGSYGTRAALVYLRRHPERVRTVVLRGVAPTNARLPLYFARDAQRAFDRLAAACGDAPACHRAFPRMPRDLRDAVRRLEGKPAVVTTTHPVTQEQVELTVTQEVFLGGLRLVLYGAPFSRHVPRILRSAADGDLAPFVDVTLPLAAPIVEQVHIGMFLSVVCAEDVPFFTLEEAERLARGTFLGAGTAKRVIEGCRGWPRGALPPRYHDPVRSDAPVLIISGKDDPVTPPSWGEAVARHLPNARHVVLPNVGHIPTTPGCVGDLVAAFVDAGSAAGLDVSCVATLDRPAFAVPGPGGG